jgi:hypothetical protein
MKRRRHRTPPRSRGFQCDEILMCSFFLMGDGEFWIFTVCLLCTYGSTACSVIYILGVSVVPWAVMAFLCNLVCVNKLIHCTSITKHTYSKWLQSHELWGPWPFLFALINLIGCSWIAKQTTYWYDWEAGYLLIWW